jgi:hypothetical protein
MADHHQSIDVSDSPELLHLAEDVQRSQEPVVLVHRDEPLAEVRPARARRRKAARPASSRPIQPASANDWLLRLVDIGASATRVDAASDVSTHKHKYLADAYRKPSSRNRGDEQ